MSTSLTGRVVAVTGAARGIGLAVARALHAQGCRVALGDIDADLAVAAATELGEGAIGLLVDITDDASFATFVEKAEAELGELDVLVNNAGIMPIGRFVDEPVATHRRALDINVSGALIGMKTVLPSMLSRGSGHVVNVASVAGKSPVPGGLTYAATKAAVVSITESARVELAGTGLRFTCVMPSFTNTDLIAGTHGTRLVRTVEPEDVADGVVRALRTGAKDVFVPKVLGPIVRTQPLLGRGLRDRLNHLLGADSVFLEVDQRARQHYDDRIAAPPATTQEPSRR